MSFQPDYQGDVDSVFDGSGTDVVYTRRSAQDEFDAGTGAVVVSADQVNLKALMGPATDRMGLAPDNPTVASSWALVRDGDLPEPPAPGDSLTHEGTAFNVVSAELDSSGVVWLLTLERR